ncbi:hypothetical protein G7072_02905 [Nocardioides sp. HDW12B]|uniref:hypothetical protein n=1 Tax=Nocardioides sp. HDW12B TaxID=2714939 RepID=UPI001407FB41|nr:hypothetical protein [Nocardioides sp. HDW12B]QIK65427.1 hypothetical protein G7072_02905 [Nocardioides sp. HDW12B]
MDESARRLSETLRAGSVLGDELIGLPGDVAFDRAVEAGFSPELVDPDVEAITADMRPKRLRLFLDETGVVRAAEPG